MQATSGKESPGRPAAGNPGTGHAELPAERLLEAYRRMTLIRVFEERVSDLYRDGEVPGFVHLSIGQEASAAGACLPLDAADVITSNHRGHGHCLARGLPPEPMMAELLARATGSNKGLGGSMHIADTDLGIFGANGIVAAGVPIAVGAAVAAQLRKQRSVVVSFFGDGAVAQGAFHEAVNLAALWRLPVVFFCENNGYAEFSPSADQHPVPLATRAAGYGLQHVLVDGNDVEAVAIAMTDVVGRIRDGADPVFVEAVTFRWHGHYEGDPERYRSRDELSQWQASRDPLTIARARLLERGTEAQDLDRIDAEVRARIEAAVESARRAPLPEMAVALSSVYAPRLHVLEPATPDGPDAELFRTMDAVRLALERELERDPDVFLAGVDIGKGGNVFALTRELHARWPERQTVLESLSKTSRLLIAHEAVTDFGIGAELAALAAWEGFWMLDAPVRRVAPPPTPSPYAPNLEKQWLPDRRAIERAIEQLAAF